MDMDDIRHRYRAPRRDYAGPVRRAGGTPRPTPGGQTMPAPRLAGQPVHHPPAAAAVPAPSPRPAEHHHQPINHAPAAAQRHTRRKRRRLVRPLIVLLVIAGLAAGGWFGYHEVRPQNPFPADVSSQTKLDLLYPAKLPPGYSVNRQDMSLSNGVLIYDATNPAGNRLVFTVQPTPSGFDFNTFYKMQLTGSRQEQTPYGTAVIGRNSGRSLGSLVDGDTWLLLSTNTPDVSLDDMSLVLGNLKHY